MKKIFLYRWVMLSGFVLGLAQGLGQIISDCSLTCNVGYRLMPVAFVVLALVSIPFVSTQVRFKQRMSGEDWMIRSTAFIAGSFFLFRILTFLLIRFQAGQKFLAVTVSSLIYLCGFLISAFISGWTSLMYCFLEISSFFLEKFILKRRKRNTLFSILQQGFLLEHWQEPGWQMKSALF